MRTIQLEILYIDQCISGFQKPSKPSENLCVPCCYNKPFTDENVGEPIPHMFDATSWTEKGETVPRDFFPKIQTTKDGKKINLKILNDKKYDKYRRKKIEAQHLMVIVKARMMILI